MGKRWLVRTSGRETYTMGRDMAPPLPSASIIVVFLHEKKSGNRTFVGKWGFPLLNDCWWTRVYTHSRGRMKEMVVYVYVDDDETITSSIFSSCDDLFVRPRDFIFPPTARSRHSTHSIHSYYWFFFPFLLSSFLLNYDLKEIREEEREREREKGILKHGNAAALLPRARYWF